MIRRQLLRRNGDDEVIRLPPVELDRLDAVITAAGSKVLPALAVLISAIGWFCANGFRRGDGLRVASAMPAAIVQAVTLHAEHRGEG
jgi:hypothetical protein